MSRRFQSTKESIESVFEKLGLATQEQRDYYTSLSNLVKNQNEQSILEIVFSGDSRNVDQKNGETEFAELEESIR